MFRFEGLEIWQLAVMYMDKCYDRADAFPRHELFALGDQLRRASVSISNNIAEGSGGTQREFSNFLTIAIRSALETVNIMHVAHRRGYLTEEQKAHMYEEAERLIRKIRSFRLALQNTIAER